MHPVDWIVLVSLTVWIVYDGLKRTKDSHELEGYLLAKRSIPWWAAGISVMATQLSAITMIGTTGQAFSDGMRFIQFYFALPLAMIILSVTLVPFFYNAARVHGLRVPGAAVRRPGAQHHQPAVPDSRADCPWARLFRRRPSCCRWCWTGTSWRRPSPSPCRPSCTRCSAACRPSPGRTSRR